GAQAQAIYWIADEALQNAVEHSGASEITLTFEAAPDALRLEVRDNGRGFPCERVLAATPALGLRLMQWEAETAGMELRLASGPQGGTIVTVVWSPAGQSTQDRQGGAGTAKRRARR
ncbi:MAG: ATP-binding protein, partial [Bryobacterales bacterium]|nr:ATP-binding protein [Bryobacterales bacterium]